VRSLLAVVALLIVAAAAWWLLARTPEAAEEPGGAVLTRAPDDGGPGGPELPSASAVEPANPEPAAPRLLVAEPPGARLAPCGRLRGRVVDPAGAPLPGTRVELAEDAEGPWITGTERVLGRADTDAEGRFAFDAIPADRAAALLVRRGLQRAWFTGLAVPADATLDLGDIVLPVPARLSGRVTDGAGAPLRGATALVGDLPALLDFMGQVLDPNGTYDLVGLPARLALGRAVTGADGRFVFDGLQPGPLVVHVSAPGRPACAQPMLLAEGEQAERTYDLAAGQSISGRAQTADGQPVQAVIMVNAEDVGEAQSSLWFAVASTDADGRFRVDGVPPGEQELKAHATGYVFDDSGTDVSAGATDVVVLMRPLRALRATVLLPDGSPAPRFALDMLPLYEGFLGNFLRQPQRWRRETFGPAARGQALLRAPAEERYIVVASGPDGLLATPIWFDAEDDDPQQAHTFTLGAPRVLRGRVTDAASGEPLPGAQVRIMLDESPATDPDGPSFTGADGRFTLEAPAGVALGLHVSAAGHADLVLGAPEGRDDAIELALRGAGSLRVLLDPDAGAGRHVPSRVHVALQSGDAEADADYVVDTCVFTRLPPGRYEVSVEQETWIGADPPDREGTVEVVVGRQALIEL